MISVAVTQLDHEVYPDYTLLLKAEEDQTPAASVVTSLAITLTNENEFPPAFSQTTYTTSIAESIRIGRPVLLVEATDNDTVSYILKYLSFPSGMFVVVWITFYVNTTYDSIC